MKSTNLEKLRGMEYHFTNVIKPEDIYDLSYVDSILTKLNYTVIDFRPPKIWDDFLSIYNTVDSCHHDFDEKSPRFILKTFPTEFMHV